MGEQPSYLDRLVADLVTAAPRATPPPLTLDEMIALLRPYVVLAHPDRVERLQAEADARGLAVDVWALPWADDPNVAYLLDRRALQVKHG